VTVDERLRKRRERHRARPLVIRMLVLAGGVAAVLGGSALLVLPGPGIPVLAVGLGILALEFDWAVRLLAFVLKRAERVTPERRGHRIALGTAAGFLAVGGITAAFVFGVPGFD
jgi:fatty acid desaturase